MHTLTQPLAAATVPASLWPDLAQTGARHPRQRSRRHWLATLRRHALAVAAVGALALAGAAEVGLRLAGAVDFPLYQADAEIGYLPRADQTGSFLNRNDWAFNALHLGTSAPFTATPSTRAQHALLVGDSIVFGGNAYAAHERLGARLQRRLQATGTPLATVWPVAAGGWSLQNELAYLQRHPEVAASAQTLVFVLNRHDFDPAASWSCTWTHPREAPRSALWFVAAKYLLKWPCEGTPPELQVPAQAPQELLRTLRRQSTERGQRVVFLLYPEQDETRSPRALAEGVERMAPTLRAAGFDEITSVGRHPAWADGPRLYSDGIHPTPEGVERLAGIVAGALAPRTPPVASL